ncbi:MAG: magnesium transporter [Verrucomicrobia bacterium]|nr:magnesium transporter [Verrucomicrobiota bacterium]
MSHEYIQREYVDSLIENGRWDALSDALASQHPADLADLITHVDSEHRKQTFSLIDDELKPDVLVELEGRAESDILESLTNAELSELVEDMAPDDAADLLGDLSKARSEEVLGLMEREESEGVRELLQYDEETAGGIMTPEFLSFAENLTIADALNRIPSIDLDEPFHYAYVVDGKDHLKGIVGLWDLLKIENRSLPLSSVVDKDMISAHVDMDQEEVVNLATKYDLSAIPVTDADGKLVGRITFEDVMDVLEEEASEDIFRMAGSDDAELESESPWRASQLRLPWLLITLVSGFVTSLILKGLLHSLGEVIVLTFFFPIVMAMGGNTGIQSSTLVIRGLALGSLRHTRLSQLIRRELTTGLIMGTACGLLIGVWAEILILASPGQVASIAPLYLAFAVSVALFSAMAFAAIYGALVPFVLKKFEIDPAVASGPFVTASNDITALLIYYGVTSVLLMLYHHVVAFAV